MRYDLRGNVNVLEVFYKFLPNDTLVINSPVFIWAISTPGDPWNCGWSNTWKAVDPRIIRARLDDDGQYVYYPGPNNEHMVVLLLPTQETCLVAIQLDEGTLPLQDITGEYRVVHWYQVKRQKRNRSRQLSTKRVVPAPESEIISTEPVEPEFIESTMSAESVEPTTRTLTIETPTHEKPMTNRVEVTSTKPSQKKLTRKRPSRFTRWLGNYTNTRGQ